MKSDEELMAAYVAGDRAAFRALFERYSPVLERSLRRHLRRQEDARDIVQQTFLQVHRARHDFTDGRPLRPWLFTISMNLMREHFRRASRRPEVISDLTGVLEPAEAPRGAERCEARESLEVAFAHLTPEQREVISLHWLSGIPLPDIARSLGVGLSAVKVRAHRGYAAMRAVLSEAAS